MEVYHDEGHGVTAISEKHFSTHIVGITPVEINVHKEGQFTFELYGLRYPTNDPVIILESGFCCGYVGEGPNGTLTILTKLGMDRTEAEHAVYYRENITVSMRNGKPKILEEV